MAVSRISIDLLDGVVMKSGVRGEWWIEVGDAEGPGGLPCPVHDSYYFQT